VKKALIFLAVTCAACGAFVIRAGAQPAPDESLNRYTQDADMKVLSVKQKPFTFSWGGWLTPLYIDEIEGDTRLSVTQTTLRLWADVGLWRNASLYVRGMDRYQYVITMENLGDSEDDIEESENMLELEMAFLRWSTDNNFLRVNLGRRYFTVGTGVVLNGRGDGAEVSVFTPVVDIALFGAYTGLLNKDENPYNMSERDIADGARRVFSGAVLEKHFGNQTFYMFGVVETDFAEEDDSVKSRYNAEYYAVGIKGYLFGNVSYYAEEIYETGTSFKDNSAEERSINAHAGLLGLDVFIRSAMLPVVSFQYAYGSGDKDKGDNSSPTGNTNGDDTGFMSFGTFQGGYGLRPVLANLHIFRLGVALAPFWDNANPTLRRTTIIAKYSYYMKYYAAGIINSGEAPLEERDAGHGIDLALRWGIFYDLNLFVNYGLFIPGAAYESDDNNPRNFILAGANLVF